MRDLAGQFRLFFVFVFKELVELVGPMSHTSDVEGEVVLHLRGRADGEGMPFLRGNSDKFCEKYFLADCRLTSGS